MCRTLFSSMLAVSMAMTMASVAQAQEEIGARTTAPAEIITKGGLKDESMSIKPLAGVLVYTDAQNNTTSRLAAGLSLEINFMQAIDKNLNQVFVGPSVGAIYSHLGDPTSNFFGTSPTSNAGQAGSNFLILPTDLKVGFAFTDYYRISAHGGGNVVYRTVANAMNLGSGSESSGHLWKYYPNVGGDLDIGLGKAMEISLRPDWTITPGNTVFAGTLSLGIFFG